MLDCIGNFEFFSSCLSVLSDGTVQCSLGFWAWMDETLIYFCLYLIVSEFLNFDTYFQNCCTTQERLINTQGSQVMWRSWKVAEGFHLMLLTILVSPIVTKKKKGKDTVHRKILF